jgi:hypothetical protein
VGSLDVCPKNHAQAPSKVICQRVLAASGVSDFVALTSDVVHQPIIRAETISVVDKMLCRYDDLSRISYRQQSAGHRDPSGGDTWLTAMR